MSYSKRINLNKIKKEKLEKEIINADLQEFIKQNEVHDIVPKKKITVTSSKIEIIDSKKDSKKDSNKKSKTEGKGFKFGDKEIFLNEEQQKVVEEDINSNIKIVASAGSGKTTTILCRIKYLTMKGVDPSRILCVTFNVDSAQNLKNRIKDLFGKETKIWIGTMDSIAFRFYKMFMPSTNFVGISEYSTMLLEFLKGKDKDKILSKFDYVFFDEFQDINKVQFETIMQFYNNSSKITVIGDDAQNIYQWRGSNIEYILNLDKYVPDIKTFKLEHNYRSTPELVTFANASIKNNSDQIPKTMIATKSSQNIKPKIINRFNDSSLVEYIIDNIKKYKSDGIELDEIAILSRNNFALKIVEEGLAKYNNTVQDENKIEYVCLISDTEKDSKPIVQKGHLTLTSIHRSKGLEWDKVFIVGCDDKLFPSDIDEISIQEERRLFYVGITRAKTELTIIFKTNVTRFVEEIPEQLYKFHNFKPSYFKYDNRRNPKFKISVTELIGFLTQEIIKELRDKKVIPDINLDEQKVHKSHKLDEYIEKYNFQSDYGNYIDRYISHSFGLLNKKTEGLKDFTAETVINSIELSKKEFTIYNKYSSNIFYRLDIESPSIQSIDRKVGDPPFIQTIDMKEKTSLIDIIRKISKKCKDNKINPTDVIVVPESYIPNNFQRIMADNYKIFQEPSTDIDDEIINKAIYSVSLCSSILENRRRLLYLDIFDKFDSNKKIYKDIIKWVNNFSDSNVKVKVRMVDKKNLIVGEADMYDKSTYTLVDFKTSTSTVKLEWILQLLTYTSILRKIYNYKINWICIYNPLLGTDTKINVEDWHYEDLLIEKLIIARNLQTERNIKKPN